MHLKLCTFPKLSESLLTYANMLLITILLVKIMKEILHIINFSREIIQKHLRIKQMAEHKSLREEITWKTEEQIIYKILEQIVSNFLNFFYL